MKRHYFFITRLILPLLVVLNYSSISYADTDTLPKNTEAPQNNTATIPSLLYQQHCATCHGQQRQGMMAPALLPISLERLRSAEIEKTIAHGKPATQMPSFQNMLSAADIAALTHWLKTSNQQLPTWQDEDIQKSHTIFNKPKDLHSPNYTNNKENLFVVIEAGDHHVSILDGQRFEVIKRIPSHFALHGGPKFSPEGRFVYFASRDGWISKFDLYSLEKIAEIRVGINTRNLAVSSDGRWVMVGNMLPQTLVLLNASDLSLYKTIAVKDTQGSLSRVSAVYDAAPRKSFIVALKDAKELWEISYNPKADIIYPGHVHDYKMQEGLGMSGYLNPKITLLEMVLDDFFFDINYTKVIGASRQGIAQIINLDSRNKITDINLNGMPHLGSGISFTHDTKTVMASTNLTSPVLSVLDTQSWKIIKNIQLPGSGFFVRSHENIAHLWVDSMMNPKSKDLISIVDKNKLEIIKTLQLRPGKTNAHVEFTRDGRYALVSIMEMDGELIVVDTNTFEEVKSLPMKKPIGKYNIFNKITRSEGTSH